MPAVYAFYGSHPTVGYSKGRRYHGFACQAASCSQVIRRYLDTNDAASTANLRYHAKACWGDDTVRSVDEALSPENARKNILQGDSRLRTGDLGPFFRTKGKSKVNYSNRQHTSAETQYVPPHVAPHPNSADLSCSALLVRWVASHNRPFAIVDDPEFRELMKTGRLGYNLPSGRTVQRDATVLFKAAAAHVGAMLKVSIPITSPM